MSPEIVWCIAVWGGIGIATALFSASVAVERWCERRNAHKPETF